MGGGCCGDGGVGCFGRGYFCDGGGRGGSRTAPTGWAKGEGVGCCGWGCCGEFRASPCSLRSRPPSRGEGGGVEYWFTLDVYHHESIFCCVVLSCRDRLTRLFASGEFVGAFRGIEQQVERRLSILNTAPSLYTQRALPSNRLESLRGSRAGQYSIRIDRQWRVCFTWNQGATGPSDVEIVDYH